MFIFYSICTTNAAAAAQTATVKSPLSIKASTIAATHPAMAPAVEPVLENTAGNVIAANTVYGM